MKEQTCCRDIELMAVSMRPIYLPREFTQLVVAFLQQVYETEIFILAQIKAFRFDAILEV